MAYIYKITNDINQKIYVGKTTNSIEERFRQHISESKQYRAKNRPLYSAMHKYGIEHFYIELIEETDNPEEREIYWIEQLGSFKDGYNATKGGDGKVLYPHDQILQRLKEHPYPVDITKEFGCSRDIVYDIAKANNIETKNKGYRNVNQPKIILQFDKNNNYIQEFETVTEASKWCFENNKCANLNSGVRSHIAEAANGKRKTAYGYIWKYKEINN